MSYFERMQVQKGNPYRDAQGQFSSKDKDADGTPSGGGQAKDGQKKHTAESRLKNMTTDPKDARLYKDKYSGRHVGRVTLDNVQGAYYVKHSGTLKEEMVKGSREDGEKALARIDADYANSRGLDD